MNARLDNPEARSEELNDAHAAMRHHHWAQIVSRMDRWRPWQNCSPANNAVAARLRDLGYEQPDAYIDWPGGWFVLLGKAVLFVAVTFRDHGHVANFPHLRPVKIVPTVVATERVVTTLVAESDRLLQEIARLTEELDQQRTRAEAAEAELRELREQMETEA
jgi:hypothetical protein